MSTSNAAMAADGLSVGFELYCDLVYADWLIQSGTCSKVIFHGKKIPWFVSDVTKKDWDW